MTKSCTCGAFIPQFCVCYPNRAVPFWKKMKIEADEEKDREAAKQMTILINNYIDEKMKPIAEITIPIKTVSEGNSHEDWRKSYARHKKQKAAVNLIFSGDARQKVKESGMPLEILITRIAPRSLDRDENLPMSMKYIKDYIADIITPGLQMGRADDNKNLHWFFSQEKGQPKEYAVNIKFYKIPEGGKL